MSEVQGLLPEALREQRDAIDAHLHAYIEDAPDTLELDPSANGQRALRMLGGFALRPGKRLRGILGITGYEMFGGGDHETALNLAAAVELAQAYLLVVDDVMDRSEYRRGGPTVQRQFRDQLEGDDFDTKDGGHLGDMLALNVALVAQHLTAGLLERLGETPERTRKARTLFHRNMVETGLGQIDDLYHAAGQSITTADILRMYRQKTGCYTFVNPLQMGAALAGASDETLEKLREFGLYAGLAYQIQDDVIGMFGNSAETGKSAMDDLWEGKRTLLMHYALERASEPQLGIIKAALGNPTVTPEQHAAVQRVLVEIGAWDYAEREANRSIEAARQVLSDQPGWDKRGKLALSGLLDYITNRNK